MKHAMCLSVVCAASLLIAGCGGPGGPEAEVKEMASSVREMTDILKTIQDEEGAKAAAPRLEALAERHKVLHKRFVESQGRIDNEQMAQAVQGYVLAMSEYGREMMRIAAADPRIREALKNVQRAMSETPQ